MKVVRYFLQIEHEYTGVQGFVPLWVPKSAEFDPAFGARGLMHDALEHRLCDSGKFHEEVMAFGRLVALRLHPGVIQSFRGGDRAANLGEELYQALSDACVENMPDSVVREAPRTGSTGDGEFDQTLHAIMHGIHEAWAKELDREPEKDPIDKGVLNRIANWLKIGYLDALRRYGSYRGCMDLGWSAFGWAEENETRYQRMSDDAPLNSVLRICIDTDEGSVKDRLYVPDDEYGRLPGWLNWRVSNWHAGVYSQKRQVFA